MPALLRLDLDREGVPKGVGQVVGGEEDAVWAQDNPMAHDVFLAPLKGPVILNKPVEYRSV